MPASLFEINTRPWVRRRAEELGRPATLDDMPDAELDRLAGMGFDWIWLLGVWQTGEEGRRIARTLPGLLEEYRRALPDFEERDVCGSCFALTGYTVRQDLGGVDAMGRCRKRLRDRGMRLMLDFVPNHTAVDHPWVAEHAEYYVPGTEEDLRRAPGNYRRVGTSPGEQILAHGRDPYFPGWTDTLQLNYAEPALQEAMAAELGHVAGQCDGVRCDMAMLVLPEIFEQTWGRRAAPFWPRAIASTRAAHPGFVFLAEVYWDLEWTLQQQGFDYAYDKRLYDRLRAGGARGVRDHLRAGLDYQGRLARFLENHDEPRAAEVFPEAVHRGAAAIAYLTPGLRFLHQGQPEGMQTRVPVQLCRGPREPVDQAIRSFYQRLIPCLHLDAVRRGTWRLVECAPAWEGNGTWDCFVAFAWEGDERRRLLGAVNYAANRSQCYAGIPFADLRGRPVRFRDLLSDAVYERDGDDLLQRGLYLDLPEWGYHLFDVTAVR